MMISRRYFNCVIHTLVETKYPGIRATYAVCSPRHKSSLSIVHILYIVPLSCVNSTIIRFLLNYRLHVYNSILQIAADIDMYTYVCYTGTLDHTVMNVLKNYKKNKNYKYNA